MAYLPPKYVVYWKKGLYESTMRFRSFKAAKKAAKRIAIKKNTCASVADNHGADKYSFCAPNVLARHRRSR